MTTAAGGRRKTDACDGVTTTFNAPQFERLSDLRVYLHSAAAFDPDAATLLTEGTDYTITGSGPLGTAQVVTGSAYATGHWLTRFRLSSRAQVAAFAPNDGIGAAKLETALDTAALIEEEQDDDIADVRGRALLAPKGETVPALASSAARDNTVLGFLSGALRYFTPSTLASWLSSALIPLLPTELKGDPGGNVMAIGLFTATAGLAVPSGTDLVRTSGYHAVGIGVGDYIHDSAVDAAFVTAHPSWSFRAADGRGFRLSEDQRITFEMFGAWGDMDVDAWWQYNINHTSGAPNFVPGVDCHDDWPAWQNMLDYLGYYKQFLQAWTYYKSVPAVHFRRAAYYSSDALDLPDGVYHLIGPGGNSPVGGGTSVFVMAAGKSGIRAQNWDTQGTSDTKTNVPSGSNGSVIEGINTFSLGGTVGDDVHGFVIRAGVTLIRCHADGFPGHGFRIQATAGGGLLGNANAWKMLDCSAFHNGLDGLYLQGGDANAGYNLGFYAQSNGMWGIEDDSFLGNSHIGFHLAGNGINGAGPFWAPGSARLGTFVHHGGRHYQVFPGQDTAASTTTPGTDPTIWIDTGAGGIDGTYTDWVSGSAYRSGGAVRCQNGNSKSHFNGYMESDQGPGWLDGGRCLGVGGFSSWGTGPYFGANDGHAITRSIVAWPQGVADASPRHGLGDFSNPTRGFWAQPPLGSTPFSFDLGGTGNVDWIMKGYVTGIARFTSAQSVDMMAGRSAAPTGAAAFNKLFAGSGASDDVDLANVRQLGVIAGTGDLSGKIVARGDNFFASAPSAGGSQGWTVTTGGTVGSTAVLKAMANLAA